MTDHATFLPGIKIISRFDEFSTRLLFHTIYSKIL
jgi:hypothetical protein